MAKYVTAPMTRKVLGLLHLAGRRGLSAEEAKEYVRCGHLARRIADLKELGYAIGRDFHQDLFGNRYARYYLMGTVEVSAAAAAKELQRRIGTETEYAFFYN